MGILHSVHEFVKIKCILLKNTLLNLTHLLHLIQKGKHWLMGNILIEINCKQIQKN